MFDNMKSYEEISMKPIYKFVILFFLTMFSFTIPRLGLANEEIELQAEKDMELIQNNKLRLREVIDGKRQDCIQPLVHKSQEGLAPTDFCASPIEAYKQNNPEISGVLKALSNFGLLNEVGEISSLTNARAPYKRSYSIDIPGRGIGIGIINSGVGAASAVKELQMEQLRDSLAQYYMKNYKLWKSNSSSLEEYKDLSAHEIVEYIKLYVFNRM